MALYDGPAVGCGYSLLEPLAEHLHQSKPKSASGSKPRSKSKTGGYYLSYVNGCVYRDSAWPQCQARVIGVSGAKFKKVSSPQEEQDALSLWGA